MEYLRMLNKHKTILILSAALVGPTVLGTAFAKMPEVNAAANRGSVISKTLADLDHLSAKELNATFNIKNAKGERIKHRLERKKEEAGIWATLDSALDKIEGTSTEKAYKAFKVPSKGKPVIVAVIDSGIDINHPDLKGHIWSNPACKGGEVEVVDDGNGYKNDCHGWNFLGGYDSEGKIRNVGATTLEVTREYVRLKKLSESGQMSASDAALFAKVSADFTSQRDQKVALYDRYLVFQKAFKTLKDAGLTAETAAGVDAVDETGNEEITQAKILVKKLLERGVDSAYVEMAVGELSEGVLFQFNTSFDPYTAGTTQTIVGDNPAIMNEKGYGNTDVTGPDASHGTHVSGIIAANRANRIGIKGQARNVLIMPVRAVPNGDERDKDIANAIRYATDMGAQIINMSFGKPYSPQKSYVDEAMAYAASKGVMLVHAAGNDGKNTESTENNFPNKKLSTTSTPDAEVSTWIEVGASSKEKGLNLPADFSNWGKTSVDVFAPGVGIVSTTPNNTYSSFNGTSMASPEVAGVLALMLNVFPNATPDQLKSALFNTVTKYDGLMVAQPADGAGEGEIVAFDSLSKTGGVVNAYRALLQLYEQNVK